VRFPAWVAFLMWIFFQVIGAWQQVTGVGNVASLAHLGGAIVGVACWAAWRNLDAKPVPGILPVRIQ
jgi:membrane associated rhomboid family serine protease